MAGAKLVGWLAGAAVACGALRRHPGGIGEVKRMLVHAISADDVMKELGVASKLNADWSFLTHLQKTGRDRAQAWIDKNFDNLGVDSTVDIRGVYL